MAEVFTSPHDRYEVIEKLAEGGMGTAYRVKRLSDGEEFLLKKLRFLQAKDWKAIERFEREAAILESLNHPQIPRYVDSFHDEEKGFFFLVQTFIRGKTLQHYIEKQIPLPQQEYISYLKQTLEILDYLHNLVPPLIHRDITPRNIIVHEGKVYLVDFGSVKSALHGSSVTSFTSVGTFGYMPPEQAMGQTKTSSDIYGLGMTFIALAAHAEPAKLPLDESTGRIDVDQAVQLPVWLREVLKEMTHPGIGERLGSAKEALELLEKGEGHGSLAVSPALPMAPPSYPYPPPQLHPLPPPPAYTAPAPQRRAQAPSKLPWWIYVVISCAAAMFFRWLGDSDSSEGLFLSTDKPLTNVLDQTLSADHSVDELLASCEGGNLGSCNNLGYKYGEGVGIPVDYEKAHLYYQKACDGGNPLSCSNLGWLYDGGRGVPQDQAKAVELYQKACDGNDPTGCRNLGLMYEGGKGVEKDIYRAVELYRKACNGGNKSSCNNLGLMYESGRGVERDYNQAASLYRKACDAGVAFGCQNLGSLYNNGRGVPLDYSQAATLYRKACDANKLAACTYLGYLYANGQGVYKDDDHAVRLYQKACEGDDALGCNNLGFMREQGRGIEKDVMLAVELYQKACDGGNMLGCRNLGHKYEDGIGVKQDYNRAAELYRKACDGKNAGACGRLGQLYHQGRGVKKDIKAARDLYKQGCDGRDDWSCKQIAKLP